MIKLVICDMDGTIIGRDEQLPAQAPSLVATLRERGVLFTVATGRSEAFMEPLVRRMGISCPYVASNGATIMQDQKALLRKQFPISDIRHILEKARGMGMSLLYTSNGVDRVTYITPWLLKEASKHGITYHPQPFTENDWDEYRIEKVLIMDEIRDGRIGKVEALCKPDDNKLFHYVRYRDKAIELMEKTANKALAITELLKIINIPLSEVLVIGDDDNDIEMFRLGATAAAVGNASKNVLPYVHYHCEKREFEGVLEAISKYCGV